MDAAGSQSEQAIRVMLVDDHKTLLWGLSRLIESAAPRMQLVETASTAEEMVSKAADAGPDVILLDLDLGGHDACEDLPHLQRQTSAQVLVLTGTHCEETHQAAILHGARGVVCKDEAAEVILHAIEKVHAGEVWINRALMGRVLGALAGAGEAPKRDPEAEKIASLTPRERQTVAAMVRSRGAKSYAIAAELGISEHTLRNHLSVIYEKLQVRNRVELFAYATEHGIGNS